MHRFAALCRQVFAHHRRPVPVPPGSCVTCAPYVEHHWAARASYGRCQRCGKVGAPFHWPGPDMPAEAHDQASNRFRAEHHHAD